MAYNLSALRKIKTRGWFILLVLVPTFLAAIYYAFFASDQYISQSRFVIKSAGQKQGQLTTIASLVQTTGLSGGQEQTNEVMDYVRSRDALRDLDKKLGIRKRYATDQADWFSRYPAPWRTDAFENLYRYYNSMVDTHLDNETGAAVLTVKAFSAQDAQAINLALLQLSENLINELNNRAESRAIAEATARVDQAEARVRAARLAMREYRNSQDIVDPAKQATGVFDIASRLISEQAGLKSRLEVMQRITPANPGIPALVSQIAALDAEIASQTSRAVGSKSGLASKIGSYENLALEEEFSGQNLTLAKAALEQARTEAAKQKYYLERIVEPNAPDLSLYPNGWRTVIVVFVAALCLFLVGWMLVVGILEHSPED